MKDRAKQLAKRYWDIKKKTLIKPDMDYSLVETLQFHCVTAYIHGYKHAIEDDKEINNAKKLAKEHWEYVGSLLFFHDIPVTVIETIAYCYKESLESGYKKGKEDKC